MFKLVSKVYNILNDNRRKALYDIKGIIEGDVINNMSPEYENKEETMESMKNNFAGNSQLQFHVTEHRTDKRSINLFLNLIFQTSIEGSDLEKAQIRRAYLNCGGDMHFIFGRIPFLSISQENEERIRKIIEGIFQLTHDIKQTTQ